MNTLASGSGSALLLAAGIAACGGNQGGDGIAAVATPVAATEPGTSNDLYVSDMGSDTNSGTQRAPFKTIGKASEAASPGSIVHVAAGTYLGGFQTTASGTAAARIRYVSDVRWAARIVPPQNSSGSVAWWNKGSYVDIDGFEIDGTTFQGGQKWWTGIYATGSNVVIENNEVHHIATSADTCTADGGSGINSDNYYGAVNNDVVGNVVHHIGLTSCIYIHGLYIVATGNVKNNLVHHIGNAAIHLWHDAHDINIANNTVVNSGFGIIVGNSTTLADHINVSNNIVFNNAKGIAEEGNVGTHNTYINNLVYQNSDFNWNLRNTHSGDVTGDPQFVDVDDRNYRLMSSSPAIGKGAPTYAPPIDLAGVLRPQGGNIDLGAFQYNGR
jgi:hypothetical protein